MGRLQVVIVVSAASVLAGCTEETKTPPAAKRSEVVLAKDVPATALTPSASAAAKPAASAPKVARKICEAELAKAGRAVPKGAFDTAAANGATPPDAQLDTGAGRWTWINFFAAWCKPCKEEIPLLRGWEQKLASALRVRFVSLDDDDRQLARFLEEQPTSGVRSTLWLKTGSNRDGFLQGLKLPSSPSLPAHALVDPQGRLRCAFEGAIDESDFAQVQAIVAKK